MPHQKKHPIPEESSAQDAMHLPSTGTVGGVRGGGDHCSKFHSNYPVHLYTSGDELPPYPSSRLHSRTSSGHQYSSNNGSRVKMENIHQTDEEVAASALLFAAVAHEHELKKHGGALDRTTDSICTELSSQSASIGEKEDEKPRRPSKIFRRQNEENPSFEQDKVEYDPSFPKKLHDILTKSDFAGSTLEWLSHGKSWRVLRWDDFSNKVIPQYFPELCTGDKSTMGDKMNKFLNYLKVWGFEEVKEVGPDMGSYRNEFFIRISPELCKYMKSESNSIETNVVTPQRESSKGSRQFLFTQGIGFGAQECSYQKRRKVDQSFDVDEPTFYKPESLHHHTGPRLVSFQEQEGGTVKNETKEPPSSSPYFYNGNQHPVIPTDGSSSKGNDVESVQSTSSVNNSFPAAITSTSMTKYWELPTTSIRGSYMSSTSLKSNRGGSRASRYDSRGNNAIRQSQAFPVSNRGRGGRVGRR